MSIHQKNVRLFATFLLFLLQSLTCLAGFEEGETANRAGDRATAFKEYHAAAHAGDRRAFGKLGSMYLYGLGTEKSYPLAYVWFGIADQAGDKYSRRFQGAAASAMGREQIREADALLDEFRSRLGLSVDEGASD